MIASVQRSRGSVLWVALMATIVAMAVALSLLQTSISNSKAQDKVNTQANAFFSTQGGVDLVFSDYYGRFQTNLALPTPTNVNFAGWLAADLTGAQAFNLVSDADPVAMDFRKGPISYTAAATATSNPTKDPTTIVTRAIPTKFNGMILGDRMISAVRLYKKERPQSGVYYIDLLVLVETQKNLGMDVASQVTLAGNSQAGVQSEVLQPQWESQFFTFTSPPDFNGFDYAVLTKNLSCTLCHMQVRNRARIDNLNNVTSGVAAQSLFGGFERSKVGITENLTLRQNSMYSVIEGTLYQRGLLQYEDSHATCTAAQFDADAAYGVAFNPNATTIAQDQYGNTSPTVFVDQVTDPKTGKKFDTPAAGGNAYLGYGTTTQSQTDGQLPATNFPAPFPEIPSETTFTNGAGVITTVTGPNNRIDSTELDAVKTNLVAASDPTQKSSLTGGTAVILDPGQIYNSPVMPDKLGSVDTTKGASITDYVKSTVSTGGTAVSVTPGAANISQSQTGNVILTGTTTNPIQIDGKVVIDGDVIIRGYIQGTGQLYVTGNIYMPGDLIYNDDKVGTIQETFGQTTDKKQNLVGMSAGKNIVIGDYLSQITTWSSGDGNQYGPYSYDPKTNTVTQNNGSTEPGRKVFYDGTAANTYLNPSRPGAQPTISVGSLSSNSLPSDAKWASNGKTLDGGTTFGGSNEPNFIAQQISLFNRDQLMKTMQYLPTKDPTQSASYTAAGGGIKNDGVNKAEGGTVDHSPSATAYDANYIPKFYSFYPYDSKNPEANPAIALIYPGSTYTTSGLTWNGVADPHGYEYMRSVDSMPDGSISDAARYAKNVINISPDWITPSTMMRIVSDEQASRVNVVADAQYGTAPKYQLPDRRLDGVMYTNNAIFCVERSTAQKYDPKAKTWSRASSVSGGHLQVNGAMIAPDTGILVNGNAANDDHSRKTFIVNYDARVKSLMSVTNQDFNNYKNWGVKRIAMTRNTGFAPIAP